MKYDILSFQTNFPLNYPRRENLVNLLEKGEVAWLGRGVEAGGTIEGRRTGNSGDAVNFCVWV